MAKMPFETTDKMRRRAEVLKNLHQQSAKSNCLGSFVLAGVGNSRFGINSQLIKEVVVTPPIAHLPNTPTWLHGLVQMRGILLCAVDMGQLFDLRTSRKLNYLLVLETKQGPLGLLVDSVLGFEDIYEEDISTKFENVASNQERPVLHVTKDAVSLVDITKLLEIVNLNAGAQGSGK